MRLIDADEIPWFIEGIGEIPVVTREEIDEMPTVNSVPNRHGKWLYIRTDDDENGVYECSECHAGEVHSTIVEVRYCWNCGARMDGGEE